MGHAALQRRAGNAPLLDSARVKMDFEKKYVRQKPFRRVDMERIGPSNLVAQIMPCSDVCAVHLIAATSRLL